MARLPYSSLAFNLMLAAAVLAVLYAHVQGQDYVQCDTPDEFIDEMLAKCTTNEVNKGEGSGKCCYGLGSMYDINDICICQRIWEKSGNVTFPKWNKLIGSCSNDERGLDCPF